MSAEPALSLTLYWSDSWSSPSWVTSTLSPLCFSNSGSAFLMLSVHTWLASVTRTVVDAPSPSSPPQADRVMDTTTARDAPMIDRCRT
ncbi:hypothetical protein [Nonomuraea salmonea]|uniref:hypothetical protein n=1 Tax=Nonomuraea salmonea TaxID=46181 RepID=UPI0031EF2EB0